MNALNQLVDRAVLLPDPILEERKEPQMFVLRFGNCAGCVTNSIVHPPFLPIESSLLGVSWPVWGEAPSCYMITSSSYSHGTFCLIVRVTNWYIKIRISRLSRELPSTGECVQQHVQCCGGQVHILDVGVCTRRVGRRSSDTSRIAISNYHTGTVNTNERGFNPKSIDVRAFV